MPMPQPISSPFDTRATLAGHLLVASPSVQDSCFARSVIYMCAHSAEGAMGVIINYPLEALSVGEVFTQLGITPSESVAHMPIYFGGPVEPNRGFVIHDKDMPADGILAQGGGVAVSASLGVLRMLASGQKTHQALLALGYAGWAAKQLESEIEQGSWLVVPASKELILEAHNEAKWSMAIATLGIDMGHYSTDVGHA